MPFRKTDRDRSFDVVERVQKRRSKASALLEKQRSCDHLYARHGSSPRSIFNATVRSAHCGYCGAEMSRIREARRLAAQGS